MTTEFVPFEDFSLDTNTGKVTLLENGKEKIVEDLVNNKKHRYLLFTAYNIQYEINKIIDMDQKVIENAIKNDKPLFELIQAYQIGILHNKQYVPFIPIQHTLKSME